MTYDPYRDQAHDAYDQPWTGAPYASSPAQPFQPADQYFGTQPHYGAPPEPPKGANVPLIVVSSILATVLVGMLVLCGFGVFGAALADGSVDKSSASPKASASPSASATSTGRLVQPDGAPYSYRVPTGLHVTPTPTSSATTGASASPDPDAPPAEFNATAVTTETGSAYDFITVASLTIKQESDEAALGAQFDRWIKAAGEDPSTRADLRVGNHLAFKYTFARDARLANDYFVFNGRTVIDVVCAWSSDQAGIQRGCQELLNTLTITAS